MGELGDRLRQAREARGLTFDQVEEITRIRRRYLQALEEEDYGQLPGEVYVRGFLRNYALALGLDAEEILAASGRKVPSPIPIMPEQPEQILDEPLVSPPTGQRVMAIAIGAMVIVATALGGWMVYRYFGPGAAAPEPTATVAEPSAKLAQAGLPAATTPAPAIVPTSTATSAPTATATPAIGVLLRLEATERVWVRVTADGRLAYEGNLDAGQVQEWSASEQILLRAGNAGGLRVWYNGQEEPALGAPGEVVDHTWNAGALPAGADTIAPAGESTPPPVGAPPSSLTPTPTTSTTPTQ